MKVKIKIKIVPVVIWLPNGIIKSRFVLRLMKMEEYYDIVDLFLFEIKKYLKENGHFNLVEIETEDNVKIVIKV